MILPCWLVVNDSTLLVSGKCPTEIKRKLNLELKSLSGWLDENKLSIHLGKTESILFASKKRLAKANRMVISCNGVNVEAKSSVKHIGLTFEQYMARSSMGKRMKGINESEFVY